jgi:hypothetical protein
VHTLKILSLQADVGHSLSSVETNLYFLSEHNMAMHIPLWLWIRSLNIGSAIVTFNPTIWAQQNRVWQYIFAANIQLALVPILAEFSIFQDQQPLPLSFIFN